MPFSFLRSRYTNQSSSSTNGISQTCTPASTCNVTSSGWPLCTRPTTRIHVLGSKIQVHQFCNDVIHHPRHLFCVITEYPAILRPHHTAESTLIISVSQYMFSHRPRPRCPALCIMQSETPSRSYRSRSPLRPAYPPEVPPPRVHASPYRSVSLTPRTFWPRRTPSACRSWPHTQCET